MPEADGKELEQVRQQRDDALKTAAQRQHEMEQARAELGKAKADLDASTKLAEASRLELGQAKNRFAAEVMKLELGAGKDFDLDARKKELTSLDLAALDTLRGELRLAAKPPTAPPGPTPPAPAASTADRVAPLVAPKGLDLSTLSLTDTLRLAFHQGAL